MLGLNRLNIAFISSLFLVACGGGGGGSTGGGGGSVSTPAPSVTLSSSTSSISAGETFTLTWSSSNATSCSASGAWSGSKNTSGSEEISESNASNNTYTLTCSGAGGSGSGSVSVEITEAIIRIDQTDLSYRTPDGGDLLVYDYEIEASRYDTFGLVETATDSGTVDLEYFTTTLPADLAEGWANFEVRREKESYSGGAVDDISSQNRAYAARVFNVNNDEGFYATNIDGEYFYGATFLPPLESGTSFDENWEFYYEGNQERKFGSQSFTISGIEVVETAVGKIEAFRYSRENSWIRRSWTGTDFTFDEEVEVSDVIGWVHPKIGIIRMERTVRNDDTPYSEDSYISADFVVQIRSTNIVLPE